MKRVISGTTLAVLVLGTIIFKYGTQLAEACPLVSDVNSDEKVDLKDMVMIFRAFGSYPNHPRWNPEADINADDVIDLTDLYIVVNHFGETTINDDDDDDDGCRDFTNKLERARGGLNPKRVRAR